MSCFAGQPAGSFFSLQEIFHPEFPVKKKEYKRIIRWCTHETLECEYRIVQWAFLLFETPGLIVLK